MQTLVIDLETERDFKAVGGKQNLHLLGVSVVGTYDYATDVFYAYEKEEFPVMEEVFKKSSLVIGFNVEHFDLPVLAPHVHFDVGALTVLDLMHDVERSLGFRVSLDNLSRATLGAGKSGMGLEAIDWWNNGEKDKVKEYCLQDVRLTRDLYEFGKKEGFVLADTRDRGRVRVSVAWRDVAPSMRNIVSEALAKRVAVELEYLPDDASVFRPKKPARYKVDVHSVKADAFEGFCHSKQGIRSFSFDRIVGITTTHETYQLQHDVQGSLI